MKLRVLAATNPDCVGMPTHGVLPAGTSLTSTTVHSSDLTMVSGPLDWKGLTASGQLSCNETLIFDSQAASTAASPEEKLAGAFVRLCPTLAQSEDTQGIDGNSTCSAACMDYIKNLGACEASSAVVRQVRCARWTLCGLCAATYHDLGAQIEALSANVSTKEGKGACTSPL
jgi:hypothetical protein